jgi:formylglycine-generating enzyme required for sulfatase activity
MKILLFFILFALVLPPLSFSAGIKARPLSDPKFLFVKGGCFQMGNNFEEGNEDEKPVHEVCLSDYYMGKYEVTVEDFKKFADESGYKTEAEKGNGCYEWDIKKWDKNKEINWRNTDFEQTDKHPVVCVSWNDAVEYAKWLSKKEGKNYRLPTEAEWEYAVRDGGKKYEYIWGDGDPSGNIADEAAKKRFPSWTVWEGYNDGYVFTSPAGSFKSKVTGLYDVAGNVWEWTSDWYGKKYYSSSPKDNPKGPEKGDKKVARGGSWLNKPDFFRASDRFRVEPAKRFVNGGFRLVKTPEK